MLLLAPGRAGRRRRRADHPGRRRAAGPAGVRPTGSRTPCWWCRSPRSAPPCTWTPSARWSTSTRCVMYPNIADTLRVPGHRARRRPGELRRRRAGAVPGWPPRRRWASTGSGSSTPGWTRSPPSASSGTTATTPSRSRPRLAVAYERNIETNARLEGAGIEVVRDRRQRAGQRPRRPALHVLPDRPRPARTATAGAPAGGRGRLAPRGSGAATRSAAIRARAAARPRRRHRRSLARSDYAGRHPVARRQGGAPGGAGRPGADPGRS